MLHAGTLALHVQLDHSETTANDSSLTAEDEFLIFDTACGEVACALAA